MSNIVNVGQYLISFGPLLRVFLANNTWYPYLCEQLSHLNRRPALKHTALWRIKRGVAVSAPDPLWYVPKTKTRLYKASGAKIIIIRPFEALQFKTNSGSRTLLGHSQL